MLAVALDEAGAQCLDDHRCRFIEALAGFVYRPAKPGEFAARQAAAQPEPEPTLAQQVEHHRLLGDARRVMPRQDHCRGAERHVRTKCSEIGHQLQIVGAEGIVEEVMLGRPQHVEA